jgi:hypothetical protein
VRRNAELLQGRVEVESAVGVGTTVRVRIPIAIEDAPREAVGPAVPAETRAREASRTPARVAAGSAGPTAAH